MGDAIDRDQVIGMLLRRARTSESAMIRVLSRDEVAWLVEPLLPTVLGLVETA